MSGPKIGIDQNEERGEAHSRCNERLFQKQRKAIPDVMKGYSRSNGRLFQM